MKAIRTKPAGKVVVLNDGSLVSQERGTNAAQHFIQLLTRCRYLPLLLVLNKSRENVADLRRIIIHYGVANVRGPSLLPIRISTEVYELYESVHCISGVAFPYLHFTWYYHILGHR